MNPFATIEEIVLQHSTRHMDKIQARFPYAHTQKAVEVFLKCPKGCVFIYTGFYVAGFAETDGPVGAYFIARALDELGYDPSMCFKTDFDLKNEVYENPEIYDIELKPYFKYANDNDIYDRVLYLLESDRINYNEWDNFLRKYEI